MSRCVISRIASCSRLPGSQCHQHCLQSHCQYCRVLRTILYTHSRVFLPGSIITCLSTMLRTTECSAPCQTDSSCTTLYGQVCLGYDVDIWNWSGLTQMLTSKPFSIVKMNFNEGSRRIATLTTQVRPVFSFKMNRTHAVF